MRTIKGDSDHLPSAPCGVRAALSRDGLDQSARADGGSRLFLAEQRCNALL